MRTTRLHVTLRDVEPRVVRVIDVPAEILLPELHDVLQVALGWTDSHLHQWRTDSVRYTHYDDDVDDEDVDEEGILLRDLPPRFDYDYDFGDGWEHEVQVLGPGDSEPGVVSGEGACPPEDCGGPPGYEELLAVLADPAHPEHEERLAWCGPLQPFDLAEADRDVRGAVGALPPTARMLLELVGDTGIALTPGGRLPQAAVRAFLAERPSWSLTGKARLEDDLWPLSVLHGLLREAGLLRAAKGRLLRTKASYDDLQAVRRLRRALDPDSFEVRLGARAVALLLASGPQTVRQLAPHAHALMGDGWSRGGRPLTSEDVEHALWAQDDLLRAVDAVEVERGTWQAGPAARSLLPGVPLLARYLAR